MRDLVSYTAKIFGYHELTLISYSHPTTANGDVIVTLLPANTKWPWVTPAIFRPELVPEELMAQGLTVSMPFSQQILFKLTTRNIVFSPSSLAHR